MRSIKSRLAALKRRLEHTTGPTLQITYKDGTKKIVSSGAAIDAFRKGEATHAESNSGNNGLLCDLLNGLND